MITPQEVSRRAEKRYKAVLQAHLQGTYADVFPMHFAVGKADADLAKRRKAIEKLRAGSKETIDTKATKHTKEQAHGYGYGYGYGYTLEWSTVNQRALGTQTLPRKVCIETLADYLAVVRKRSEFEQFTQDAALIRRRLPALETWLQANPQHVIENAGHWSDLLTVCEYFMQQPRPQLYIRELPIAVHTKFIEQHTRILRDLLDAILPPAALNTTASSFAARFGLRDKPVLLRLRLLDEQLDWTHGLRLDDLTLPVQQAAHLLTQHLKPRHVVIVENLINFLTLPPLPETVGLFGGGFAIHVLRDVDWLQHCNVLYWGDLDAYGFQMLADLRRIVPQTRSVMMDQATWDAYAAYITAGATHQHASFETLTPPERKLADTLMQADLRLEQEHIPHADAVRSLQQAIRDT